MMKTRLQKTLIGASLSFAFTLPGAALAETVKLKLSGYQEVLPVMTLASASGTISVADDHSISGSITTEGIAATAARIQLALAKRTGPVVIALEKTGKNTWTVPAGAKLSDAQYVDYKAGGLYVNVLSDKHANGEIRAQILP